MKGGGWALTEEECSTAPVLTWMCTECTEEHAYAQEQRQHVEIAAKTGVMTNGSTLSATAAEFIPNQDTDAREEEREGSTMMERQEQEGEAQSGQRQQSATGHTAIGTNRHTAYRLAEAERNGRTLEIYSDGSKIHGAGSYAWIAGF